MKNNILSVIFCTMCFVSFSQNTVNNYKYLVIPMEFDFTNGKDKFRLNTLTRYLFKKEGFEVYFEEEDKPKELEESNCTALFVDVKKRKGGFFKTKIQILLKDCLGKVVYESELGESREKDFKSAYTEGIRNAFKSIERLKYKYIPPTDETDNIVIQTKKQETEPTDSGVTKTVVSQYGDDDSKTKPIVSTISVANTNSNLLNAKNTEVGYDLLDDTAKVVLRLISTSVDTIFLVDGKNAVVFNKMGAWVLSEYIGNEVKEKVLSIKF